MIAEGNFAPNGQRWILGPDVGQCCGGKVDVAFEVLEPAKADALTTEIDAERQTLPHVAVFGAGHVGLALIRALLPLPFRITCVDDREERIPKDDGVTSILMATPEAEVATLPPGTLVFVMTHSHDLDYKVTSAALARRDLPFVGLIGSATKRARFLQRMQRDGLSEADLQRLVSPIGMNGISGKTPAVIAASAAAQILQVAEALETREQSLEAVGAGA
jgi:xanthine dehydrogenase accessory factor